jgi:hypothetical protein
MSVVDFRCPAQADLSRAMIVSIVMGNSILRPMVRVHIMPSYQLHS